jgi:hypothetical protein
MQKNFCVLPFTTLLVRADSTVSVCCMNGGSASNPSGEPIYLYESSLEEAFHSPFLKELRASMLADERHPSCSHCWKQEDSGSRSKRQDDNVSFKHWLERIQAGDLPPGPIDLSLNLGTLCNLRCRICGPTSSSRYAQEYLELFGEDHIPRKSKTMQLASLEESRALLTKWPYLREDLTNSFFQLLPHIERLEFLGGEPFLNKKQFELVAKSVEIGASKTQDLNFVTNGTIYPEEAINNHWPHFKTVVVNMSADGIGPHFEYNRNGAQWDQVLVNLNKYRSLDCVDRVNIFVSVSLFTIFYLPEILEFWDQEGLTAWSSMVTQPARYDARVLPATAKRIISLRFAALKERLSKRSQEQLAQAESFMHSQDLSSLWLRAIENIWFHDGHRKESFAKTFPEFHHALVGLGLWYDYQTQKELFVSSP